ncbi:DUF2939 domain-containing protein [Gluconacetobacter takamatsuzukensis]|uniref:DUF2939 domain-containing protein n=2 Tax=Gluconacetobacter takamatsuzukensis TaxID=1286190 RepID=A0A7W4KBZ3_9PROT|nr:DUF2939 domain-containing protein [Gluconacetobacter takamatsuzukensis]
MNRFMRLMPAGYMVAVRRQQARRICAVTLVMSLSLFVASPFVTLWSVSAAIQSHDTRTLGTFLNWRAIQASLKSQIISGIVTQPASDDDLPEFGSSFAATAVSRAIDVHVNAANLDTLMGQVMPAATQTVSVGSPVAMLHHVRIRFLRPDMFEARAVMPGHERETPLRLQMRIQGWRWKITEVDLPASRADHPAIEASAAAPDRVALLSR